MSTTLVLQRSQDNNIMATTRGASAWSTPKDSSFSSFLPPLPKMPIWPHAGQRLSIDDWAEIYARDLVEIFGELEGYIDGLYEQGYEIRYNPALLFESLVAYLYSVSMNTLKKKNVDLSDF